MFFLLVPVPVAHQHLRMIAALIIGLLALSPAASGNEKIDLVAPNPEFHPLNQLRVSGNACGPAALLSAFGFGSERWQELGKTVPGSNDRQRISAVIDLDRVVLMENGEIIATGTHEELMGSSELYQEIYESQLGSGVKAETEEQA